MELFCHPLEAIPLLQRYISGSSRFSFLSIAWPDWTLVDKLLSLATKRVFCADPLAVPCSYWAAGETRLHSFLPCSTAQDLSWVFALQLFVRHWTGLHTCFCSTQTAHLLGLAAPHWPPWTRKHHWTQHREVIPAHSQTSSQHSLRFRRRRPKSCMTRKQHD